MLRDLTIRRPLETWLRAIHCGDESTRVLHELKMPRPSARIDLVAVNGELTGFEIKSDVDSLARLDRQQKAFSLIFDRVSIVTTRRYIQDVERIVPSWWGLLSAEIAHEKVMIKQIRYAEMNNNIEIESLVNLLNCKELQVCLKRMGVAFKSQFRRRELIEKVLVSGSLEDLKNNVRLVLKSRADQKHPHEVIIRQAF